MNTDTRVPESTLPFPVFVAGSRGYNCPGLKLWGYSSLRSLESAGKRLLTMPRAKLASKGIFLPNR